MECRTNDRYGVGSSYLRYGLKCQSLQRPDGPPNSKLCAQMSRVTNGTSGVGRGWSAPDQPTRSRCSTIGGHGAVRELRHLIMPGLVSAFVRAMPHTLLSLLKAALPDQAQRDGTHPRRPDLAYIALAACSKLARAITR